jgi:drug/metabolite transporter (DMT)-like permease
MRRKYSLITYICGAYTTAALMLLVALPVMGSSIAGLSGKAYLYCFLMAVICQLTGHSIFNWALKRMQATVVTIATLGEPVGTSLLAVIILGESPLKAELAGGVLILAGLFSALYFNPSIAKGAAGGIKGPRGSR